MRTIYGKRNGCGFDFFKDEQCTQKIAHQSEGYFRKNRVVTLNCWDYYLIVVK
jgi:hypothetical protein